MNLVAHLLQYHVRSYSSICRLLVSLSDVCPKSDINNLYIPYKTKPETPNEKMIGSIDCD